MKGSIVILSFFIAGVALGTSELSPSHIVEADYGTYALYVLMFLVGIGVGTDLQAFKILKEQKLRVLLIPFSIVVGSLLGGLLCTLFLPEILVKDALSIVSGLGYYSLSSIFITEIRGEELGAIALMANIIRELITLVLAPFFIVLFGKLAGIASGGATAMDTTLPIIAKYSGKEWAVISVFSGIVLTLLVPFLVTFVLETF